MPHESRILRREKVDFTMIEGKVLTMRLKTDFDPQADFSIFLVSRLVAVMTFLAFGEGRVKAA